MLKRQDNPTVAYKLPPTYQIFVYKTGIPTNGEQCADADKIETGDGLFVCQDELIPEPEDPKMKAAIYEVMGLPLVPLNNETSSAGVSEIPAVTGGSPLPVVAPVNVAETS